MSAFIELYFIQTVWGKLFLTTDPGPYGCFSIRFHSWRDSPDEKSIQKEVETVVVKKDAGTYIPTDGPLRPRGRTKWKTTSGRQSAANRVLAVCVSALRVLRSFGGAFPDGAPLCSLRRRSKFESIGQKYNSILSHLQFFLFAHHMTHFSASRKEHRILL